MGTEFNYLLAFATGVFGAFHCLGMCSGIAAGFFVRHGWQHKVAPHVAYHAMRILVYTGLGTLGALFGQVLVQSGTVGKGQGILMIVAGIVVILFGLGVLGILPWGRQKDCQTGAPAVATVRFHRKFQRSRTLAPGLAGIVNGFVPCSLVFSVAVKAMATADPLQAGLLMLSFGLGTVPTMVLVTVTGAAIGAKARGVFERLAGVAVVALGVWTLYEGVVFYDIMRGLAG
ncbi:sulfite exporter TauE/SafE family protein [Thioalbus denitrificans]|uniref:Urease accessory protein UreH-like transmembrane domain-containing protein n=1 Tax=Thioalbus denitrificans TaxID=547122 RepID=A0A369CGV8_9GAMM|nr:sulfite exporter TauE/SafE family protein [Thioalbus denitrificans]RCX33310.1 hypothetical protein DFQ59_101611 [Thioalbus denitrificans]